MKIKTINLTHGEETTAQWNPRDKALHVVAEKDGNPQDLIKAVAECIIKAMSDDEILFIPLKEASRRLDTCVPKLQEYARSHYKGFPAVLDGNKYKVNPRMLPEWADRITMDAIEGNF